MKNRMNTLFSNNPSGLQAALVKLGSRTTVLGLSIVLLASCNTTPLTPRTETPASKEISIEDPDYKEWKEQAEVSPLSNLPVPAPLDSFEGKFSSDTPSEEPEETVALPTINVTNLAMNREVDVAVLLRALADLADVNIIIGENVQGPIRINLQAETRWDRLFLSTIQAHGLHYEWKDDFLRVMSREDIERQTTMERALGERQKAMEERKSTEPLVLELYRVRYADALKLAASVKAGLAEAPNSQTAPTSVTADPDSGLLIIHATPGNMTRAKKLAVALDQPAYQILIEATIVQANSETARELGFRWGAQSLRGDTLIGTAAAPGDWNSNFPAPFNPAETGFTMGLERLTGSAFLQAQLSALQREGQLNIISNPSITTLDKQTAVIESGEERPFQSSTGAGFAAVPTIEFKRAVLRLEVTPQVIDGQWIKLLIDTTKDEFDDSQAVVIDGTLQVPITTRAASTMLYLSHGQTTVIGGLSTESKTASESGIPILKDLPVLGALFRNRTNRTALSDTMIFITPYVLPSSTAPQ